MICQPINQPVVEEGLVFVEMVVETTFEEAAADSRQFPIFVLCFHTMMMMMIRCFFFLDLKDGLVLKERVGLFIF